MIDSISGSRVTEADVAGYDSFKRHYGAKCKNTRCLAGKYHLIHLLFGQGYDPIYLDAVYRFGRPRKTVVVDVLAQGNGEVLLGLCQDKTVGKGQLYQKLALLSSTPARIMLALPFAEPLEDLKRRFHRQFFTGKFAVSPIPEVDSDGVGEYFREALDMASLLANRTRIQMLLPLLIEPASKSHYRVRINPKLVYENLSILTARGLVKEITEKRYGLTRIGNRVLTEYLVFLQKMRETLESEQ